MQSDNRPGNRTDYGMMAYFSPVPFLTFSAGYLSDVVESDEALLGSRARRSRERIGAYQLSAMAGNNDLAFALEWVGVEDHILELDAAYDKPEAWNAELSFYPSVNLEWSLRVESARELEEAPKLRGGVNVGYWPTRNVYLAFDYLISYFERVSDLSIVDDDEDEDEEDTFLKRSYDAALKGEFYF